MKEIKQLDTIIQTGDNLLVSTDSFLGHAIQDFQRCKWNHAGKFLVINGIIYVCEADKRGICLTDFNDYVNNKKYSLLVQKPVIPFNPIEKDHIMQFALPRCGHKRYEYLNLFVYQPIKFLTGIWLGAKTARKGDRAYICGEWVARIDNVVRGYFPKWEKLAPVDLFNSELYINYKY